MYAGNSNATFYDAATGDQLEDGEFDDTSFGIDDEDTDDAEVVVAAIITWDKNWQERYDK